MTISSELRKEADDNSAKILSKFFKTGKGQYGEGDRFLGIKVPKQRFFVRLYWKEASMRELYSLLHSEFHEERLTALLILVRKYEKSSEAGREKIFNFYLNNISRVNNWDLVDLSAPNIVGEHLFRRDRTVLYKLARSKNLWKKRIAIISTLAFIRKKDFAETLKLSKIFLSDSHDLIHKAVGWMLREVGKREIALVESFLEDNIKIIPRTTLRYAIEKMPESKRHYFLTKQ
jgi:3-methyladenine DNA glycosylase AlkD